MQVNGWLHLPVDLPLEKAAINPLNRRLGEPQSLFRRYGENKNC
jgi:hypothetical protein